MTIDRSSGSTAPPATAGFLLAAGRALDGLIDRGTLLVDGRARQGMLAVFSTRLSRIVAPVTIFERRLAGLSGGVDGAATTPDDLEAWLARLERYPELAYLVGTCFHDWRSAMAEVLERLESDRAMLERTPSRCPRPPRRARGSSAIGAPGGAVFATKRRATDSSIEPSSISATSLLQEKPISSAQLTTRVQSQREPNTPLGPRISVSENRDERGYFFGGMSSRGTHWGPSLVSMQVVPSGQSTSGQPMLKDAARDEGASGTAEVPTPARTVIKGAPMLRSSILEVDMAEV